MQYVYDAMACPLGRDEIAALEFRLSTGEPGGLLSVSKAELEFLRSTDMISLRTDADDTLRDEFAKAALQGTLANGANELGKLADDVGEQCMLKRLTCTCYRIADAMMAERSKRRDRSSD